MATTLQNVASLACSSSTFLLNKNKNLKNCNFAVTTTNTATTTTTKQLTLETMNCKNFTTRAIKDKTEASSSSSSAEEITKKYGLEVGLWKIFNSKEEGNENGENQKSKGDQAKELLAKYGGAYLATSITLSLISFSLCFVLVSVGVDVQALLQKVGISSNEAGEKIGTFALAYAAHKAASPIRFPPTVALTPIVAGWIGKKVNKEK